MMPTICNEQAPVPLSGVGFLGGTGRHIRRGGSGADVGWGRLRRPWWGSNATGDRDEGDASVPTLHTATPAPTGTKLSIAGDGTV